jgi:TolB-like protein/Tfp pilus assembly protein PilF
MSLIAELKRRKVFKVGGAYLVVGWLLIQVAATVAPQLNFPEWVPRLVTFIILLGFPITMALAWVFDVTPEGVKLDTNANGSKRIFAVAAVLAVLAVGWYFRGQPAFRKGEVVPKLVVASVASVDPHSIAVLPFVNMSADPAQEFFSDGIAEELLNRLAQFSDLKVAARTSAFQFKGKNLDVADIGRQLKVSHVLEGSVRKEGTRLRITAQLIDCATGYHLWSETYERDGVDVFKVQDEISTAIAGALEAKLSSHPAMARPVNAAAYDDYLQGRAFFAKRVGDNLKQAVAAFDRAIARDPTYSPAYSGRAFALAISDGWSPWLEPQVAFAQARASVEQALRLDPNNAEAYLVRGQLVATALDAMQARADYERAYALAPGNVDVLNFYGDFLETFGDLRGAERLKRQAMALDPLFFVHPMNLAEITGAQGRFAEAVAFGDRAVTLGGRQFGEEQRFWPLLALKRLDEAARSQAQTCILAGPDSRGCLTQHAALLAAAGQAAAARNFLADFQKRVPRSSYARGRGLAMLYANYVIDIPAATAAQRESMRNFDWPITEAILLGPGGARLPEEISRDPDWLAVWADPKLREVMELYRANLAAFRKGN